MKINNHILSILQALFVTFLWSTSFIIIKLKVHEIPPITFAGLRYSLAVLFFLPFIIKKKYIDEIKTLTSNHWKKLFLLGLIYYVLTQGSQFVGLSLLPAITVSMVLNLSPLIVTVMGIFFLDEKPSLLQWAGSIIFIAGIFIYFIPVSLNTNQILGLIIMLIGVMANAGSSILGRSINRNKDISPIIITFISMGIGAIILLSIGISEKGIPDISLITWIYLLWLSAINTAFAFTLWNLTLRTITAMESSIINGTMLIQIAILSFLFLSESISFKEGIGMIFAASGAILVQIKKQFQKTL